MRVLNGYSTLEDAHLGRSLLESEGIDAQVLDECAALDPHLLLASGIRLAVADEDAAEAREILGLSAVLTSVPKKSFNPLWMILVLGTAILTVLYAGIRRNHGPMADAMNRTELDRNQDGKPDERLELDRQGVPVAGYGDDNFDGRWDRKSKYQGVSLSSAERDLDFDGIFDSSLEYQQGVLITETIRPGGGGYPLFRHEYREGVLALTWSDKERDGRWDERIAYDPAGREIERTTLK
ncbi:MAG: hypothetical protein V4819_22165 [Verrucomicrobiota bacterium]